MFCLTFYRCVGVIQPMFVFQVVQLERVTVHDPQALTAIYGRPNHDKGNVRQLTNNARISNRPILWSTVLLSTCILLSLS